MSNWSVYVNKIMDPISNWVPVFACVIIGGGVIITMLNYDDKDFNDKLGIKNPINGVIFCNGTEYNYSLYSVEDHKLEGELKDLRSQVTSGNSKSISVLVLHKLNLENSHESLKEYDHYQRFVKDKHMEKLSLAKQQGVKQGSQQVQKDWSEWNLRRETAEKNNQVFNESPPKYDNNY